MAEINDFMYLKATAVTLIAWIAGLFFDANIVFGTATPQGFFCFRILFPLLGMGLCILYAVEKRQHTNQKQSQTEKQQH